MGLGEELQELARLHDDAFNGEGYQVKQSALIIDDSGYPSGHIPFDEQGTIPLPVEADPAATILSFIVPNGYDGVIELMSCTFEGGGFVSSSGDIVWRLRADGRPIRNFEDIRSQKGSLLIPREIRGIRIYSNQVISVQVVHPTNPSLNGDTSASLGGYYYPSRS